MPRLPVTTYEGADQETKKTYEALRAHFGKVPNIFAGMANSPVTLNAYLKLDELIASGSFSAVEQDIVRITVSEFNQCRYCVAAHTASLLARRVPGDEILRIRRREPSDPKHRALIAFTVKVLETKGFVTDGDISAFKDAGYTDKHVAELPVIIAQKTLSNYFNHINDTELDLPAAPKI